MAKTASAVTGEANPGTTNSATVDAGRSVRHVISRYVRLPSGSLVFCQVADLELYLQHTAPSAAVNCCEASSQYRMSFGILPSSIRRTWPSQRSLRCLSSVNIVERPARARTSTFGTLSLHLMWKMRRRQRIWKLFSLSSCFT